MLIQREVKSKKNYILLLVTLASLILSGYLFYTNYRYFSGSSAGYDTAEVDLAMKSDQKDAEAEADTNWRSLDIKAEFLRQTGIKDLRFSVPPLKVDEITKGKSEIFTRPETNY